MAEFAFLFRGGAPQGSPEQMQQQLERWAAWMKELAEAGRLKNRGAPLDRRTGKLVKGAVVTDGPYAEKDVVAGFVLIEADDLDHAVRLAAGCPIHRQGGLVEVRETVALRPL
jgi:hypothetical protein